MSGFVLTLRGPTPGRFDASPLVPDRLGSMTAADVSRLPLRFEGGDAAAVADLFEVEAGGQASVRFVGDLSDADGLGCGTRSGTLIVEGQVGRRLGMRMSGGRIEATGDAGDGAGLEMTGGTLLIRGSAGRGVGSASPGSKRGMSGGEILVFGNAGAEVGACMRRGLIAVAGDAGSDAARGAIAGTVLVGGNAAAPVGRWSKRGSVVVLGQAPVSPTYRYACTFRPPHVSLLLTYLRRTYGFPVTAERTAGLFERYSGDMAESGAGEILRLASP